MLLKRLKLAVDLSIEKDPKPPRYFSTKIFFQPYGLKNLRFIILDRIEV
jgi:hypothetical protein